MLVAAVAGGLIGWWLVGRYPLLMRPEATTAPPGALRGFVSRRRDPAVASGLLLTAAAVVVVVGALVLAFAWLAVRHSDALRHLDSGANEWGRRVATPTSDRVLYWVTDLADIVDTVIIGVTVAIVDMVRRPNRWAAPFLLVAALGVSAVSNIIKHIADRARPTVVAEAAALGPSFPSGHSATAAAFYAAVALVLARHAGWRWRRVLGAAAVGIALAVAATRVMLGVHWVSDVVAGLAVGWAWFAACAILFGRGLLKTHVPAAVERHIPHRRPD